ncbi:hypothetical protein DCAR_0414422 [Daucus carota subsp. sativus]|uniref:Uncharacterized protein n=1 Tax=Daucus carota subsp. sativus TaxID=79200 RepID=A0A175YCX8_DAUCS|nr:hypothetical protein DCAR_0414422 [Daucus carota subsp. sativus]
MANMSNALIAHDPRISQQDEPSDVFQQTQPPTLKIEEVEDEDDKVIVELEDDDEDVCLYPRGNEKYGQPFHGFYGKEVQKLKVQKEQTI